MMSCASVAGRQKCAHCASNLSWALQKDEMVTAVNVDDRVLRKPRNPGPRFRDNFLDKPE